MKIVLLTSTIIFFMGFVSYFEQYIYFSFWCAILFFIIMIFDMISAVMLEKVRGGSFETNKGMKWLAKLIGYIFLLFFSDKLNQLIGNSGFTNNMYDGLKAVCSQEVADAIQSLFTKYHFSAASVFFYAFIITSLSTLKNFQLCDSFQNFSKLDRWLYVNIDLYKNEEEDRLWMLMNEEQKGKIEKMKKPKRGRK